MKRSIARSTSSTGRTKDPEGTRALLVQCAFEEIYEHGYAGASLDRILSRTGLTRGALYHHFGSKAKLAHAVIDDVVRGRIVDEWTRPLQSADDPLQQLINTASGLLRNTPEEYICRGCPLNNLNQELSNADEEFRTHLNQLYDVWRDGIASGLERGKSRGVVRQDVDCAAIAAFVVSVIQGVASTVKSSRNRQLGGSIGAVLIAFLESLKPTPAGSAPA